MLMEVDQRQSNDVRVTLYYDDSDQTLTVKAEDLRDPSQNVTHERVPVEDRAKAFDHPFAYGTKAAA